MSGSRLGQAGRNLGWIAVSVAAERALFFLTTLYLARVLGVAGFGALVTGQALALGVWTLVDLGVSGYGVREIARDRPGALAVSSTLLGARLSAAILAVAIWTLAVLASGPLDDARTAGLACSLFLLAESAHCDWVCRGLGRFHSLVLGSLACAVVFLAGCLLWVRGPDDLPRAALVWSGSYGAGSLVLLLVLHGDGVRVRPDFRPSRWLPHVRRSLFFTLGGAVLALHTVLPVLALARIATAEVLGLFAGPYRLVGSAVKAGGLLHTAFFPVLAEARSAGSEAFAGLWRRYCALGAALGAAAGLTCWLAAEPLVAGFLGPSYAPSSDLFRLLGIAGGLRLVRLVFDTTLLVTGHERLKSAVSVAGVVTLVAVFALAPGAERAEAMALGVLASDAVLLLALALATRRALAARPAAGSVA